MRAVTVEWDAAASFLICAIRSSGRLIVVLMHQSISSTHIDVNLSCFPNSIVAKLPDRSGTTSIIHRLRRNPLSILVIPNDYLMSGLV